MENKPISRKKNITDGNTKVQKRGAAPGPSTGPVGNAPRPGAAFGAGSGSPSSGQRSSGAPVRSRSPLALVFLLIAALLGGGGASMLGGMQGESVDISGGGGGENTSMAAADETVAEGSRTKYTSIIGNGSDTVTLMVYMCGTDLESKYGMASNDLGEMAAAELGDNVNVIVYTGGCSSWRTPQISSTKNQIYRIKDHSLELLESDMGSSAMTEPSTLTGFIKYCAGNFPANRQMLIFWDHGGGSVSGYGYDEKYKKGSMTLSGINTALKDAGEKFDFIGFDACLMATLENALMLSGYGDYMIASEETEPGVGWYYTNWLSALGGNTSIATVELGKRIVDDFVTVCATSAKGQKTTLSVVDLSEISTTVPESLSSFSKGTIDMIKSNDYQEIADARARSREFAVSSKIDQVDAIDLAQKMNTSEGRNLAEKLKGAIKYNRTSANMTNSYGISIYFPCRKLSNVDSAVSTYDSIGMDSEYTRCIQEYAKLQATGQVASSQSASDALGSLLGTQGAGSGMDYGALLQMMGSIMGEGTAGSSQTQLLGALSGISTSFLTGRSLSDEAACDYVTTHSLNDAALKWTENENGDSVIRLSRDQWKLVTDIEMNMFVDDGEGFIDMGCDNLFDTDVSGNLIASRDNTWLAINGEHVAYYHLTSDSDETGDNYTITGYVPAMLNGERVRLLLTFDNENENGYIAGAESDYTDGETELSAKALGALTPGDTLEFICDYYSYDGTYEDTYYLGEPMTVTDDMQISDVPVDNDSRVTYVLTDIYGAQHWTPITM